jgi:hypothetical protein
MVKNNSENLGIKGPSNKIEWRGKKNKRRRKQIKSTLPIIRLVQPICTRIAVSDVSLEK